MVSKPSEPTSMASPSNSSQSSSAAQIPSPLLLLSNMSNLMSIKLDNINYLVWKLQLIDHIDGTVQKSSQFLVDVQGNITS
jgi:hypothetical protein